MAFIKEGGEAQAPPQPTPFQVVQQAPVPENMQPAKLLVPEPADLVPATSPGTPEQKLAYFIFSVEQVATDPRNLRR
jgi:hypothetical protein